MIRKIKTNVSSARESDYTLEIERFASFLAPVYAYLKSREHLRRLRPRSDSHSGTLGSICPSLLHINIISILTNQFEPCLLLYHQMVLTFSNVSRALAKF